MKNKVKSFKFQFSLPIQLLFVLALLLSAAGIGLTIWRIVAQGENSVYVWMQHAILLLVSALMAILVIAMLLKSEYTLTNEQLILSFGLIRSKYDLKKIYSVHLFRGAKKLAVYFDDYKTNYIIIYVKESWYDEFIKTLVSLNPKIGFSFSSPEEEENFKRDNK